MIEPEENPQIIMIGDGSGIKGTSDLRRLIREGKIIVITGAILEDLARATNDSIQNINEVMSRFSAEITVSKESMESLKSLFEETMVRNYEYNFIPIHPNYKKPNLFYKLHRDKRKYRAAVNRR
ncbi:hypothetical protein [Flavobacterium sp. 102]|uniref:hypothetical protein n=1 Tax=Flavobacterium sp. 102 TaxID=2135623 RepID=UPI000EB17371|nr:hypothetical protein [Flavobacterium sp. 102]RKS00440.1 hypothetical protein C8C84_0050 [Flavobacterium sp. 102]